MGPIIVILVVLLVALALNQLLLTERCHELEMRLRGEDYEGGHKDE
ncbi:hypothetical protein [Limosilactobacillus gorillae]|nr:hypothetical protein [Limosilactobacillus gorillae]